MTMALDMSLDELIKHNKSVGRGGGGRGGRGNNSRGRRGAFIPRAYGGYGAKMGAGPSRRQMYRASFRQNPYATAAKFARQAPEGVWQRELYENVTQVLPASVRPLGIETGTKLYISNLDYGVSNDDIKELFSEVGDVKRCSVHYDRSGRSKGTAEVVFSRKADGLAALKRYSNVQLDGKAMTIELIGTNLITSALPPPPGVAIQPASVVQFTNAATNGLYGSSEVFRMRAAAQGRILGIGNGTSGPGFFWGGRWGNRGRGRGRGGKGRGRGRGRSRGNDSQGAIPSTLAIKSATDLDAELETYHSEAMNI